MTGFPSVAPISNNPIPDFRAAHRAIIFRLVGGLLVLIAINLAFFWYRENLLRTSLRYGDVSGALRALQWGADPDGDYDIKKEGDDYTLSGESYLIRAIKLGTVRGEPIVAEMIRRGADPGHAFDYSSENDGWSTAFLLKDAVIVRRMLTEGARPGEHGIDSAALGANKEILEVLFSHSISLDAYGGKMLHRAAWSGNIDAVEYLVSHGVPVNTPYDKKRNQYLSALVKKGDSVNESLQTPLMDAASNGQETVMRYLLQQGANVHCRDIYGKTVLDQAMESRNQISEETDVRDWENHQSSLQKIDRIILILKQYGAEPGGKPLP